MPTCCGTRISPWPWDGSGGARKVRSPAADCCAWPFTWLGSRSGARVHSRIAQVTRHRQRFVWIPASVPVPGAIFHMRNGAAEAVAIARDLEELFRPEAEQAQKAAAEHGKEGGRGKKKPLVELQLRVNRTIPSVPSPRQRRRRVKLRSPSARRMRCWKRRGRIRKPSGRQSGETPFCGFSKEARPGGCPAPQAAMLEPSPGLGSLIGDASAVLQPL